MKCGERNTECKNTHKFFRPGLFQDLHRKKICLQINEGSGSTGQQKGKKSSQAKKVPRLFVLTCCKMCSDQTGKSRLDSGGSDSEQKILQRDSKLKQSDSFCTNRMRKEYPIKKADHAASKASTGKKDSALKKSLF